MLFKVFAQMASRGKIVKKSPNRMVNFTVNTQK